MDGATGHLKSCFANFMMSILAVLNYQVEDVILGVDPNRGG